MTALIGQNPDGSAREVLFCPECKQADDHPRHRLAADDYASRHLDCCRDAGCPDGSCDVILGNKNPGPGEKMLKHVLSYDREELQRRIEKHQQENPHLLQFTDPRQQPVLLQSTNTPQIGGDQR